MVCLETLEQGRGPLNLETQGGVRGRRLFLGGCAGIARPFAASIGMSETRCCGELWDIEKWIGVRLILLKTERLSRANALTLARQRRV